MGKLPQGFTLFFPTINLILSSYYILSDSQQTRNSNHCYLLQKPFMNGKLLPHLCSAFRFHELTHFPPPLLRGCFLRLFLLVTPFAALWALASWGLTFLMSSAQTWMQDSSRGCSSRACVSHTAFLFMNSSMIAAKKSKQCPGSP